MKNVLISCLDSRVESNGEMYGRFLFGPVPRGLAVTIATALRRSLLSEVESFAITHVEFIGPRHEFSTLPGTRESVLDVLLNLKKLTFISTTQARRKAIGYCSGRGPGVITGRDLKLPPGIQCTNPDQIIAHLADNGHLHFSYLLSSGKSYVMKKGVPSKLRLRGQRNDLLKQTKRIDNTSQGTLSKAHRLHPGETQRTVFAIDAVFMPVRRVNFMIQSDEDILEFPLYTNSLDVSERVIFEIWTNGNVTPREAIHQAATHLIRLFSLFQLPSLASMFYRPRLHKYRLKILKKTLQPKPWSETLQTIAPNHFLEIDIAVLPISPTLFMELKARKIERLADFLHLSYEDLLNISGMTREILFEVLCMLRSYGIRFLPKLGQWEDQEFVEGN